MRCDLIRFHPVSLISLRASERERDPASGCSPGCFFRKEGGFSRREVGEERDWSILADLRWAWDLVGWLVDLLVCGRWVSGLVFGEKEEGGVSFSFSFCHRKCIPFREVGRGLHCRVCEGEVLLSDPGGLESVVSRGLYV